MTSTIYCLLALLSFAGRTTQHIYGIYPTMYGSYPTHQGTLSTSHTIYPSPNVMYPTPNVNYPTPNVIYPTQYGLYPTLYGTYSTVQDSEETCEIPPTNYVSKPIKIFIERRALVEIPGVAILTIGKPIPYLQTTQSTATLQKPTYTNEISTVIFPDVSNSYSHTHLNAANGIEVVNPSGTTTQSSSNVVTLGLPTPSTSQSESDTKINVVFNPDDPDFSTSHSTSHVTINKPSEFGVVPGVITITSDLPTPSVSQSELNTKINMVINPDDLATDVSSSHVQIHTSSVTGKVPVVITSDSTSPSNSNSQSINKGDVVLTYPGFTITQGSSNSGSEELEGPDDSDNLSEDQIIKITTYGKFPENNTPSSQIERSATNEVVEDNDKTPDTSSIQNEVDEDSDDMNTVFISEGTDELSTNPQVELFSTRPTSNTLIGTLANAATNLVSGTLDSDPGNAGVNLQVQGTTINSYNEPAVFNYPKSPSLIDTLANAATNLVSGTLDTAATAGNVGVNIAQGAANTFGSAFEALGK